GDLGPAVRRPRLLHVVDLVDVLLAGDDVGRDDALVAGGVGEHEASDSVANRVEVRLARPHPAVDLDEPLLDLGLGRLEADLLDVRGPASGDEHHLGPQLLLVLALRPDLEADPVLRDLDLRGVEAGVRHDRDPAPAEAALERLADVLVLEGHDRGQVLQDGHLRAEVVVHRRELDADRAAADDDDVLRERVRLQDVVAGHDALAVDREARQRLDPRAGGEDHVVRLEEPVATLAGRAVLAVLADADLRRALEAAAALDPGDLVLVDQRLEAGPEALHDLVAAGGHLDEVDLRLAGQLQPEVLRVPDALREGGRFEQRLRRDAPAMEARPADLVLVDEGDLEPQLGCPERGRVPAGARAEDDEIERVGGADGHGVRRV